MLKTTEVISSYPTVDLDMIQNEWSQYNSKFNHKIIVLDDDPTGVQTVHSIPVYTDWSYKAIEQGFQEDNQMFFILTNSRAFTEEKTKQVHQEIAVTIEEISQKYKRPYILISRGDSTLRGHYPLETKVLRETIEQKAGRKIDGEVLIPFFREGGRLTVQNTHYIDQDGVLIPVGETEFANDRTFGYSSSHLGEWIEEKTKGEYTKDSVTYISLDDIRAINIDKIYRQLMSVSNFNKVVVNALAEEDVSVFASAMIKAIQNGKQFLFRTAASFTKIIGNVKSRPLLTKEELIEENHSNGGLILIGSHVKKTTEQLNQLKKLSTLHFIELDSHLVLNQEKFKKEIDRVRLEAEQKVKNGITTVIYTRRELLKLGEGAEEELQLAVKISDGVTSIVSNFAIRPKYIIAKGGITSSDIGTKGLGVKRANVAGQIAPGIPVWQIGTESKFPNLPYIIFPGNVGAASTLKDIVTKLEGVKE
ncbi:hydroxyacid dehydrogenase [Aeribacillus pallidus]|uniref:four-carbon acid sugar kinase family protein n=1 Tax=Aeribacillus pallidus TaxID=33936 RepID=UPI001023BEA3|nr:four-carbon acid sugar kinase family protein [Aeribacillus pallidus]RZI52365.1 hydroxyacid dehydrogenase [Aeribacillus pallidus]